MSQDINTPNPIDPRIRKLSYSSLLKLHSCPRRFQLYKLGASGTEEGPTTSVTFAFGHTVGKGIQDVLEGKSIEQCLYEAFIEWEVDLDADNPKQKKSFWSALAAIIQFHSMRSNGYLEGYELVYYQGTPSSELSFVLELPDGFHYVGFIDAVLQHRETHKVMVLENKTTSSYAVNPAQYKYSGQALGYSIVLDVLFPELSAYEVTYLIYQTKSQEFVQMMFEKSYYSRALWIRELLMDIDTIKMYEEAGIYPLHGESCFQFGRECEFFQICTLSTERLIQKLTPEIEEACEKELEGFQIKVSLDQLLQSQLKKQELGFTS